MPREKIEKKTDPTAKPNSTENETESQPNHALPPASAQRTQACVQGSGIPWHGTRSHRDAGRRAIVERVEAASLRMLEFGRARGILVRLEHIHVDYLDTLRQEIHIYSLQFVISLIYEVYDMVWHDLDHVCSVGDSWHRRFLHTHMFVT